MLEIRLDLPWRIIPKKRHYRRKKGGGFYLSKEFKDFEEGCLTWLLKWGNQVIHGPVDVTVTYFFKDKRWVGDEDNLNATIGDMLQKGGFVDNDKLIHWLPCERIIGQRDKTLPFAKEGAEITIRQNSQ